MLHAGLDLSRKRLDFRRVPPRRPFFIAFLTMFPGVTRVHARSPAAQFLLQIELLEAVEMRPGASRVSFPMCPFCVRAASSSLATDQFAQI